jgi:hypothetical protein
VNLRTIACPRPRETPVTTITRDLGGEVIVHAGRESPGAGEFSPVHQNLAFLNIGRNFAEGADFN